MGNKGESRSTVKDFITPKKMSAAELFSHLEQLGTTLERAKAGTTRHSQRKDLHSETIHADQHSAPRGSQ